jgi:hypothetical protein
MLRRLPLGVAVVCVAAGAAIAASLGAPADGEAPETATSAASSDGGHGSSHDHAHDASSEPADGDHPYANRHLLRDWPEPDGSVPTRRQAEAEFTRYESVEIRSDTGFNPANGVVGGNGTADDPWIIENVHVEGDLYIADTSDHFVIRESYIDGQLTLNWVGDRVHVHDNHIEDLRVNENVRRTGEDTAGRIEENRIEFVGQIRHYDGVFRDNTVGPYRDDPTKDTSATLGAREKAMQLDGMHGGDFHGNTFTGWVEIKLHGHHHGSCWTCLRHHHANETVASPWNHTIRYNRMSFHDNHIRVPEGVALRYTDEAHNGDDGAAASEAVQALNLPHRHFTRVYLWNNTLLGGGLRVDIFNARSEDHPRPNPGRLVIEANTIRPDAGEDGPAASLDDAEPGIHVNRARTVNVTVADNTVRFRETGSLAGERETRGVVLDRMALSNVTVAGNRIAGAWHGVEARHLPGTVHWTVEGNAFEDVDREVWWDSSVENPPRRG